MAAAGEMVLTADVQPVTEAVGAPALVLGGWERAAVWCCADRGVSGRTFPVLLAPTLTVVWPSVVRMELAPLLTLIVVEQGLGCPSPLLSPLRLRRSGIAWATVASPI